MQKAFTLYKRWQNNVILKSFCSGSHPCRKAVEALSSNPSGRQAVQAFTLIELLVVVLIIGILSAIALPQYQTAVDKANYSTMMAAVRAMKNEQELYYLANGVYTTSYDDLRSVFPNSCNAANVCGKFHLSMKIPYYVYGVLNRAETGVGNSYLMNLAAGAGAANQIYCYAYKQDGARGRKLCASMGAKKITNDNAGCDGGCTIYQF